MHDQSSIDDPTWAVMDDCNGSFGPLAHYRARPHRCFSGSVDSLDLPRSRPHSVHPMDIVSIVSALRSKRPQALFATLLLAIVGDALCESATRRIPFVSGECAHRCSVMQ